MQLNLVLCCLQEATRPAIPILLAVGAVHQHLIQNGLRMSASIIADTAQCFSTHQFACLIGYGARLFQGHKAPFCFYFSSLCDFKCVNLYSFVSLYNIVTRIDTAVNLIEKVERFIVQSVWHTTLFICDLYPNILDSFNIIYHW